MQDKPRDDVILDLLAANRSYQTAVDALDDVGCAYLGVSRSDGRVLDALQQREPMTAGQLAAAAGLTSGGMTAVIDRLERAGWLRRVAHPADRRRVLVETTPQLHAAAAEVWGPMMESLDEIRGRYTDDEIRLITEFLALGRERNEQRAAAVRARVAEREPPAA